ncbi:amino acid transporter [Lysinibacillus sp. KU-BSD001]|uniref:amino acid transporter n=1 Tax=Lysinibacillus sp. KU-BSD001 TaxID=3141328 RepID=UPI0036E2F7BB
MVFHYKFWHLLFHPSSLTHMLEHEEEYEKIRGYKKALWLLFFTTLLFFAIRNLWGMHTESLTALLANGLDDRYMFARLISLGGAVLWAIAFFIFHYYVLTYVLHLLTDLPFKWIQKVQLYVMTFIVLEKAITFLVFAIVGFTTPFTFFSLAPITAYFYQDEYVLYFLNQLTVATVVTIIIQYTFLSQWEEESKKILLAKLIFVQIGLALLVGAISILPILKWIEGGVS